LVYATRTTKKDIEVSKLFRSMAWGMLVDPNHYHGLIT